MGKIISFFIAFFTVVGIILKPADFYFTIRDLTEEFKELTKNSKSNHKDKRNELHEIQKRALALDNNISKLKDSDTNATEYYCEKFNDSKCN